MGSIKNLKNTFSAALTGRPMMELLGKLQIPVSEQIILLPFTAGHAPLHVNLLLKHNTILHVKS